MIASQPPIVRALDTICDTAALADLVALDRAGEAWRNRTCHLNLGDTVLGGQLAAHCLLAAANEADGFLANALHVLFVSGPGSERAWRLEVESLRNGRRFAHRLVRLTQDSRFICHGTALLAANATGPDTGLTHFPPMPDLPAPEALQRREDIRPKTDSGTFTNAMFNGHGFMDIRPVPDDAVDLPEAPGSRSFYWLRMPLAVGLGQVMQQALLTMATDFWYSLPLHQLAFRQGIIDWTLTTSLDHCVWFHAPVDCSDWMLFQAESFVAHRGAGMKRALVWHRDGSLVANVEQRGLAASSRAGQGASW